MPPIPRACLSTPMVPFALAHLYGLLVVTCRPPSLPQPLNTLDVHPSSLTSLLKPSVFQTPISRSLSPEPHILPYVSPRPLFHLHPLFGPHSVSDPQPPIILFVPPSTHSWSPAIPIPLLISLTLVGTTRTLALSGPSFIFILPSVHVHYVASRRQLLSLCPQYPPLVPWHPYASTYFAYTPSEAGDRRWRSRNIWRKRQNENNQCNTNEPEWRRLGTEVDGEDLGHRDKRKISGARQISQRAVVHKSSDIYSWSGSYVFLNVLCIS